MKRLLVLVACVGMAVGGCGDDSSSGNNNVNNANDNANDNTNQNSNINSNNNNATACTGSAPLADRQDGVCADAHKVCNDSTGTWDEPDYTDIADYEAVESRCDELDNDCDGETDEGLTTAYYPDADGDSYGSASASSIQACAPPTDYVADHQDCDDASRLVNPDATEECDGLDNNCDGDVDEGCDCINGRTQACYSGSLSTRNVGECHDGSQLCTGGQWGPCTGEATAIAEVCNDLDDDCDGVDDNGDPGGGGSCDTGLQGVCAAGVEHCVDGGLECEQTVQSSAEICDGQDNDCDSQTADGAAETWIGMPCDGDDDDLCAEGVWQCENSGQVCSDNTADNLDLCDGSTNEDCDPSTPDGYHETWWGDSCDTGLLGVCAAGSYTCEAGMQTCTQVVAASAEICDDSQDNDCDGQVDGADSDCP